MKIYALKRGNFDKYSFKDLEYGLKLVTKKIADYKTAIKVIEEYNRNKNLRGYSAKDTGFIEEEVKKLEEVIKNVQDEIANRLLTGNDDGAVARELLGAEYV